jgi:hypothetical protein
MNKTFGSEDMTGCEESFPYTPTELLSGAPRRSLVRTKYNEPKQKTLLKSPRKGDEERLSLVPERGLEPPRP